MVFEKNALNYTIPSELGLCTNLTYLALAVNNFTGLLPLSLSNLTKITKLGLSDNSLSGDISPNLIANWTQLVSLQLQNNQFSGKIPSEVGLLTKQNYLLWINSLRDRKFERSICFRPFREPALQSNSSDIVESHKPSSLTAFL